MWRRITASGQNTRQARLSETPSGPECDLLKHSDATRQGVRGLFTGQLSQRGPPPTPLTHTVNSLSRGGVHKELRLCDIHPPRSQRECVCLGVGGGTPPTIINTHTHTQTRASLHVSDNQNYRQNMNASRPITPEEDVHSRHCDIITLLLNRAAQQGEPMSY